MITQRPTGFASLTDNPYMRRLFERVDRECEARQRAERALYHSMRARTIGEVMERKAASDTSFTGG